MKQAKFTIREFNQRFPDENACLDAIRDMVYPNGIECRTCRQIRLHHRRTGRKQYSCDYCGTLVAPLAGTIFEKSSTPLKSWFYAMFLMASTRTGISAKQLERELGVTYKTAWRMFSQIRKLMTEDVSLSGRVEADETYLGGKSRFKHKSKRDGKDGRGASGKVPVIGAVERKGKIAVMVAPDASAKTIMPFLKAKVMPKSIVFTDEWRSYDGLTKAGYRHERVHHGAEVYVIGEAHTQTIDGFWSLCKRGIGGVNHVVSHKHLQSYMDSYAFRWNHREDETPMYDLLSAKIAKVRNGKEGDYSPVG